MKTTTTTRSKGNIRSLSLGILLYVLIGQATQRLPNPILPGIELAPNIVVPIVVGYLQGSLAGAFVGFCGTLLNFALKLPLQGPDFYELAAILPYTLMGTIAGWQKLNRATNSAALSIIAGQSLRITTLLLTGLLPLTTIQSPIFWAGSLSELTFNITLIVFLISFAPYPKGKYQPAYRQKQRSHYLILCIVTIGAIFVLSLSYFNGVTLALELFVLPIVFAALTMGPVETWAAAIVMSCILGIKITQVEPQAANQEIFFIFSLNLVALTIGLLADRAREQRHLAEKRLHEIQQAYTVLVDANRIKDQMIQNVSHELRTPLSIILGYTELLNTQTWGQLTSEQCEAMQVIKQNATRLSKIVEQVTMLHDIREGRLTWHPTSLGTLVKTIVDFQKQSAARQKCTLSIKIENNIPLIDGDALYLGRAVEALVDNAIKFSPQGGAIKIKAWTEDNKVFISVQDHGIGISEEQQSRLFKCFSQVDGSAARRFGGIGTGLALVKEVIQAHNGEIWVESAPGNGSTFSFWVPIQHPIQFSTRENIFV